MSLFRPERRTDYPTSSLDELYRRRQSPLGTAGVSVDNGTAMRLSSVWSCIDLISSMGSTLPLDEFLFTQGERVEQRRPPLFVSPDGVLSLTGWLYQVFVSLLTNGNAYGLVLSRGADGFPTAIQIVSPAQIQVQRRGEPYGPWEFKLNGKPIARYDRFSGMGDLWHLPAYLTPGSILGLSPIAYAAATIGTGLAAQDFGNRWFRDNATPAAVLRTDKTLSKETATLVKRRWMDALFGNREPVVLGDGWTYEAIQVPANESQFLETMRASTVDIARYFRVPPSEIGASVEGSSMTYANIEQRAIALLTYTLNPWLVRLEESLSSLRPPGRYVKFNVDALLRTELVTRYRAHDLSVRSGWRTVNEIRAIEDLEPVEDGDRTLWPPLRMQLTQEEMGTGDLIEGPVDAGAEGG